jgi:hypothetical protein
MLKSEFHVKKLQFENRQLPVFVKFSLFVAVDGSFM